MANCRNLKKDVNFLCKQVSKECFTFIEYSPGINIENVLDVLSDSNSLRVDLLKRINNYPRNNKELSKKKYFKNIVNDLYKRNIEFIERLNTI